MNSMGLNMLHTINNHIYIYICFVFKILVIILLYFNFCIYIQMTFPGNFFVL